MTITPFQRMLGLAVVLLMSWFVQCEAPQEEPSPTPPPVEPLSPYDAYLEATVEPPDTDATPPEIIVEITNQESDEVTTHTGNVDIDLNETPSVYVVIRMIDMESGIDTFFSAGPNGGFTCQEIATGQELVGDNFSIEAATAIPVPGGRALKEWRAYLRPQPQSCGAGSRLIGASSRYSYRVRNTKGLMTMITISHSNSDPEVQVSVQQP